jgi:hypothetical protein
VRIDLVEIDDQEFKIGLLFRRYGCRRPVGDQILLAVELENPDPGQVASL